MNFGKRVWITHLLFSWSSSKNCVCALILLLPPPLWIKINLTPFTLCLYTVKDFISKIGSKQIRQCNSKYISKLPETSMIVIVSGTKMHLTTLGIHPFWRLFLIVSFSLNVLVHEHFILVQSQIKEMTGS